MAKKKEQSDELATEEARRLLHELQACQAELEAVRKKNTYLDNILRSATEHAIVTTKFPRRGGLSIKLRTIHTSFPIWAPPQIGQQAVNLCTQVARTLSMRA